MPSFVKNINKKAVDMLNMTKTFSEISRKSLLLEEICRVFEIHGCKQFNFPVFICRQVGSPQM